MEATLDAATTLSTKACSAFEKAVASETTHAISTKNVGAINHIVGCLQTANPGMTAVELLIAIKHQIEGTTDG